MVDKNCSFLVAGLGKSPFGLAEEAWCQYEVVSGDAFPWLGGNKDSVLALVLFAPPCNLSHCAKQATCTFGSTDIDQSLRDLTMAGKLLELLECKVSKMIVPTHQLSLVVWSLNGVFFGLLEGWRRVEGQGGSLQGAWMLSFLLRRR
jgi:hypothetical protein